MRSHTTDFALACAGGIALALAGPPLHWHLLAFAAPALLLAAIAPDGRPAAGVGRAAALGLVAGFVTNAIALYWIIGLLERFASFPQPAAMATAALLWLAQGLTLAFATGAAAALGAHGAPRWLALCGSLVVAFSLTPALFPWRPAASQVPWLAWIQVAELGGEPLLDLAWALSGCGLLQAADPLRRGRRLPLAAGLVALLLPAAYGAWRLPRVRTERERAPGLSVGVVQPNVDIGEKHAPGTRLQRLRQLRRMTRAVEKRGARLVVWPETAYPFSLHRRRDADAPGPRAIRADGVEGPLLFGALTVRGGCDRWNSVIAMDGHGHIVGVADKVRLLAFGEYVPLWHVLPPLQEQFTCPGLRAGRRPEALRIASTAVGVLNCYEDILGSLARRVMQANPELLVNVTNDAWFGDTTEPHLHHQLAHLRSIETRRDLIRAVNTGVSGHIAATGEDVVETGTWVQTSFVTRARLLRGQTPWVRFGDVVTPALAGALVGSAFALRSRRRPGRRSRDS